LPYCRRDPRARGRRVQPRDPAIRGYDADETPAEVWIAALQALALDRQAVFPAEV